MNRRTLLTGPEKVLVRLDPVCPELEPGPRGSDDLGGVGRKRLTDRKTGSSSTGSERT